MKGDEEAGPETAMAAVWAIGITLLVVGLILLSQNIDVTPQGWISPDAYPSILKTESLGSFQFTDLDHDTDRTTSTEIACEMARAIRSDFTTNGFVKERQDGTDDYRKIEIEPSRTVVARGAFQIKWNSDTQGFWKFEDLSTESQQDMMKNGVCIDKGTSAWKCTTPYVDEKCLATAFGQLKASPDSDNYLCTGKNPNQGKITAGGPLQSFGDSKCESAADGKNTCADAKLCPGADLIGAWRAPGGTSIKEYVDDEERNAGKEWPPFQCLSAKCEPIYAWFAVYNKAEKEYAIEMARMVEQKDLGAISTDTLVDKLLQDGHKFRTISVSYPYPELRTKYDFTFIPTNDATLSSMLTRLTKNLGSGWNVEVEQCSGDCLESAPKRLQWRIAGDTDYTLLDQSESSPKYITNAHRIYVKAGSETGEELNPEKYLDKTHKYHVVLRWWQHTLGDTTVLDPKCQGWCGGGCTVCIEDSGNAINIRCLGSCELEPDYTNHYNKYKDITRYQDYTLIIIDMGPAEAQGTELLT